MENNRSPTYREITYGIGARSTAVASHHVRSLERMGLLDRAEHLARGLSPTVEADELLEQIGYAAQTPVGALHIPIRGVIQAGSPVESFANEDTEDTIIVDSQVAPGKHEDLFAVKVRGDSMIDALIQEGDVVLLQKTAEVRDGDMVAAWLKLEQETTLKYYYRAGNRIQLKPANPAYDPIEVPAENVAVQGKVVLVQRQPAVL